MLIKAITGKPAGSYGYRVRACNAGGCSAYAATRTVTVSLALAAPSISGDTAALSSEQFNVTWTAVSVATSYELQQRKDGAAWGTPVVNTTTSVMLQRSLGGLYEYQVRACNSGGCSGYSGTHGVYVTKVIN